jgi:hypothetical protein
MFIEIRDLDGGLGNIIIGREIIKEEEYVDALKEHLTQDEDKFKKYRYCLSDYTATTEIDITTKSVDLIALYCQKASIVNPEAVVAIVANEEFIYGLARMWEILIAETYWETMVFRNREGAEAWIKEKVKEKYGIDDLTFS